MGLVEYENYETFMGMHTRQTQVDDVKVAKSLLEGSPMPEFLGVALEQQLLTRRLPLGRRGSGTREAVDSLARPALLIDALNCLTDGVTTIYWQDRPGNEISLGGTQEDDRIGNVAGVSIPSKRDLLESF